MSYRFLIVGAGFSGSVLARELVSLMDCHIDIWDERAHLAGNCYTSEDEETGIMVHQYGPHIFNTDKKEIWDYFNKYSPLRPYVHHVQAMHKGKLYTLPVNLNTLQQFFGKKLSPEEAKNLLEAQRDKSITHPDNFEEQALSLIGKYLYYAFFYGYTKKQWGCEPRELPASVMRRLPVRFDHNDNYHLHPYTGIPEKGYTDFVKNLVDHPKINVTLNRKFTTLTDAGSDYDYIFYTGAIDRFFNYEFGALSYRTLRFEREILEGTYQGCTQVNFTDEDIPYTRITEHKHFTPWKTFDKTVIFKEYSSEAGTDDILYYPKRLKSDKEKLERYIKMAEELKNVSFLGRLGTYRYLDMQHVIQEALEFTKMFREALINNNTAPIFLKFLKK
ncbi:MAG: UDP-galactopyranose mutase [Chitinophagaceae bacterium]|nr:UDP-galactopyranose mutase [Chitinophagaceae bacterium]